MYFKKFSLTLSCPVITNHGDFIYFSSDRSEGLGGADIYRSRLTKTKPMEPENVGPEINSEFNETDPALRMAGFHLLFNSDREATRPKLFSSKRELSGNSDDDDGDDGDHGP